MVEGWWLRGMVGVCCCAWSAAAGAQEGAALSVEDGVRLALEQNESLRIAHAQTRRAQAQVVEQRAEGLPQLDLGLNYTHNWVLPTFVFDTPQGRNTVKIGTDENLAGTLRLRQSLYAGGGVRAGLRRARAQEVQAREAERLVTQQVRAEVEERFCALLHDQELARVGDLALARARANLGQVEALRQAGRVADYDLLRAQVEVANLCSDSTQAHTRREVAALALKQTLGLPLDHALAVAGSFRDQTHLELGAVEPLVRLGMEQRPELRQQAQQVRSRQSQVKVEQARALPQVEFQSTGQMQFQSNEFDLGGDDTWRKNWSTALALQVPLFDGLRIHARVAQAAQEARSEEATLAKARRVAELEIHQAWMELAEVRERLQARQGIVDQAEKGLQVAEARYASGVGTQLEILDAHLLLLQAQTNQLAARRDQALALVRLERAVGVLGE
ncbi:MAG: TolC family protein [Candidatus Latescibacteria bacterium]|nr:TolC family protein [Candidatus Latescibacterota bacterium]